MKKNSKKNIVKQILNEELNTKDEKELINLLLREHVSIDVDKWDKEHITIGDKIADRLTKFAGSWFFIVGFSLFLIIWILLNLFIIDIDPYPFILLNLLLSCLAALQAPIIMMSENREAKKEVLRNKNDYRTNLKSELILEELYKKILVLEEKILDNKEEGEK